MKYLLLLGPRVGVFGLGACLVGTALLVAACSSEDSGTSPAAVDGSTAADGQASTPEPDGSTAPVDAGGEMITEGGGLLPEDPDGGTDTDGGIDAGPACGTVTPGTYSTSTCSSFKPFILGGALTTTAYQLKSVTVLSAATFCANGFVPYNHRGGLKVTASSASTATFEFVDVYGKATGGVQFSSTTRYDAQVVASGSQLTFTAAACAAKPVPATGAYTVGTDNGKKALTLRIPYGTGTALYKFVEP